MNDLDLITREAEWDARVARWVDRIAKLQLTDDQADGWACVACGRNWRTDPHPDGSVPIGPGPRGTLFICVPCDVATTVPSSQAADPTVDEELPGVKLHFERVTVQEGLADTAPVLTTTHTVTGTLDAAEWECPAVLANLRDVVDASASLPKVATVSVRVGGIWRTPEVIRIEHATYVETAPDPLAPVDADQGETADEYADAHEVR